MADGEIGLLGRYRLSERDQVTLEGLTRAHEDALDRDDASAVQTLSEAIMKFYEVRGLTDQLVPTPKKGE